MVVNEFWVTMEMKISGSSGSKYANVNYFLLWCQINSPFSIFVSFALNKFIKSSDMSRNL